MRIGLVVQPMERVPPLRSGAVEFIASSLVEGLVREGHDVTLFASGDSITSARLVSPVPKAVEHDRDYSGQTWWPQSILISQVLALQDEFDVIHSHAGYWFLPALHALRTPALMTWHGYVHRPITRRILSEFRRTPMIAPSDYQRRATSDLALNWIATIPHGIPYADLPFSDSASEYLLFLGRINPVKRPDLAIRIARSSGLPIRLAGPVNNLEYFRGVIQPLLRPPDIEFVGEITGRDKARLLGEAVALIHTSEWESFGVAVIESLACGTPVLCFDRCSLPELVQHGVTGFVCDTPSAMREACLRVATLDRHRCRDDFLQRFTCERMVSQHERWYERLCGSEAP